MAGRAKSSTVGVRELRQNLSIYLDRVKKGEALTVTEHGQAVAVLRPLPPATSPLSRLVAEGRATSPKRAVSSLGKPLRLRLAKPLTSILDELREERF
jgi:prevent-host-death family protein